MSSTSIIWPSGRRVCWLLVAISIALSGIWGTPAGAAGSEDVEAAIVALNRGQYARAGELAQRAIESGTLEGVFLARAYGIRAQAFELIGHPQRAKSDNLKAISVIDNLLRENSLAGEDLALAYNVRGTVNIGLGRPEEAISDFTAAVETMPSFFKAYLNRGNVQLSLRHYTLALRNYEAAMRVKPDYAAAVYGRARTLVRLGRYDEAIATYGQALEMEPKAPSQWLYHLGRGNAHFLNGDHALAIADYESSLALNPNFGPTKTNLKRARAALRKAAKSPEKDTESLWDEVLSEPETNE